MENLYINGLEVLVASTISGVQVPKGVDYDNKRWWSKVGKHKIAMMEGMQ